MCRTSDKRIEELNIRTDEALTDWTDIPERRLFRAVIRGAVNDALDPRVFVDERDLRGKSDEEQEAVKEKARDKLRSKAWEWIFDDEDFLEVCDFAYEDGEMMAGKIQAYVREKAGKKDFVRLFPGDRKTSQTEDGRAKKKLHCSKLTVQT